MKLSSSVWGLAILAASAVALPVDQPAADEPAAAAAPVSVALSNQGGTVVGSSIAGVDSFNAIPYAEPPIGPLRLRPPKRLTKSVGSSYDARGIAPACPQMLISSEAKGILASALKGVLDLPFLKDLTGQEDCLTVTVQRPAGTAPGAKLPVLFWMFGGAFSLGATNTYNAASMLNFGADQKQPFIFVAVNYRVGGFGFLPGKEVLQAGAANLGLLDQRMGLEWVADNIEAFGGDPSKVTIWGESAGSISVFTQMALYGGDANYKGKSLFRGAIMNSGSLASAAPVDCPKAQAVYNQVVDRAGCKGVKDTLECLRQVDYKTFLDAANSLPGVLSYNSVALSYLPRPDGKVLLDSPDVLAETGKYHAVPMIIGDQEDEGTIFSLFQPNVTDTEDQVDYLSTIFFQGAKKADIRTFVETYEPALTEGSPFRTGIFNDWYPGYKRLAAMLGDLVFTLTRRVFLTTTLAANPKVPAWSYLSSYDHGTPIVGTFHGSDILQVFYGLLPNYAMRSCRTYYFNFLYNLDPNVGVKGYPAWPEWKENKELMWWDSGLSSTLLKDDFRQDSAQWIAANVKSLYL